ncbi:HU family DNA-binding protein [Devosia sp.]|uniref:HU family DNA-binding protein n=1 Tax=Devosia sp. TaxID=1871048 RepID=UPI001AD36AD5|nr:HU family DNA-binding protein [Devosia sp.]MBN9335155.1 HU family DNA-binding protein [Devosia sp.]
MSSTVTRALITTAASDATGIAKSDVNAIGQRMFELIGDALKAGQTVKLTGFGTLAVRSRAERIGRNPRTGTEHRITPRHTVVFTPSAKLREALDSLVES